MTFEDAVRNYAATLRLERLRLQSKVSILQRVENHLFEMLNANSQWDAAGTDVTSEIPFGKALDPLEFGSASGDVSETTSEPPIVYTVESRTRPGVIHNIRMVDGELICDCEAGKHGRSCWHVDEYRDFAPYPGAKLAMRIPHKEKM